MVEIVVFLLTIIGVFVLCNKEKEADKTASFYFENFLLSTLAGFGAVMITMIITFSSTVSLKSVQTDKLIATAEIVTLADNSEFQGKHYLGSGSVGTDNYYVYYTNTERGYKQGKIRTNSGYLKYISSNETPHIEKYSHVKQEILTKKPKTFWVSLIGYLAYKNVEIGEIVEETISSDGYYVIYIPEGTLKENYVVDLE